MVVSSNGSSVVVVVVDVVVEEACVSRLEPGAVVAVVTVEVAAVV